MDPAELSEMLPAIAPWMMWAFVAVCGLSYFVFSYLCEILAQKLDQPRWMAWVPLVNGYLMFKLVGWEKWFFAMCGGYVLAFATMWAPGPLMMLGAIVMIPTALAAIVLGFAYWPKLSVQRGLSMWTGLLIVLPQFAVPVVEWLLPGLGVWVSMGATLVALGAMLMIVFHDGGPESGPHPIGYALTIVGCLVIGALLHTLPGKLLEDPSFQQKLMEFTNQAMADVDGLEELEALEREAEAESGAESPAALIASLTEWTESFEPVEPGERRSPSRSLASTEPDPQPVAKECPAGAREQKGRRDGGREWWCEVPKGSRWIRHGPARTWHPNGYLASEGTYDRGVRHGTWTRYWRTGGRQVQAEFRDGFQNGWMHRWDGSGDLKSGVLYEDGEVVTSPASPAP